MHHQTETGNYFHTTFKIHIRRETHTNTVSLNSKKKSIYNNTQQHNLVQCVTSSKPFIIHHHCHLPPPVGAASVSDISVETNSAMLFNTVFPDILDQRLVLSKDWPIETIFTSCQSKQTYTRHDEFESLFTFCSVQPAVS